MTDIQEFQPRSFWNTFGRFLLLLLVAQLTRAALVFVLQDLVHISRTIVSPLAFIGMAAVVFIIVRPNWQTLGLDLRSCSRNTRILYIVMAVIVIGLIITTYFMDRTLLLQNIYGVLIVPIIEEALFRGLGWQRISTALPQKNNALFTWIITSIVFGLWHLGYADAILFHAEHTVSLASLPTALLWKVLIGGFIGGVAGLARWKTRKLPASIFVHALFNMFGR